MTASLARTPTPPHRAAPVIYPRLDPEMSARPLLDQLLDGRFTVHGETHRIGDPVDWLRNPSDDVEWHIVLHKFGFAPGLVKAWRDTGQRAYLERWQSLTRSWIAQVPPGFIAADVTGRRIRNLIYALTLLGDDGTAQDRAFVEAVRGSLVEQADWLQLNLHARRNHRTLELFALFLAGIALEDPARADFALEALADNAVADFLPDGVHVELSSHYHCLALRSLVETVELAGANAIPVPDRLVRALSRAQRFARALHKPDGTIPALSDADVGDYRDLLGNAPAPGPVEVFPDGGYVFLRDAAALRRDRNGAYLVLDCGEIGAGNHGHLDCLSIEFAARGRSLIVDPGRFTYFEGGTVNERARFRGTAAHNLVQVDGREQTRYRPGPRRMMIDGPSPVARIVEARPGFVHAQAVIARHDVILDRRITVGHAGWWLLYDRMRADDDHDYDLRFQLSADAEGRTHATRLNHGAAIVRSPDLVALVIASHRLTVDVEPSWVAPRYGQRHPAPRIRVRQRAADGWFATLLVPFTGPPPAPRVDLDGEGLRISLDGGATSQWVAP